MDNLAATIPSPKAPLEIQPIEAYNPDPHELLVRNEIIAFNPVEYKIAKLALIPVSYPAILGSTLAGTIAAVGSQVTNFQVGQRVVISKRFGTIGNQYGAYQRYVLVAGKEIMVSRVPANGDAAAMVSVMMNATCVVGLFSGRLGLERPSLDGVGAIKSAASTKGKKILVYGGSSAFCGLSVQYLSRAGYTVVTTSSPKQHEFVSGLSLHAVVIDHTAESEVVIQGLVEKGPYDIVVDAISVPHTLAITARVLAAQGGGILYTMNPPPAPSGNKTLPDGVECRFEPWSDSLYEEKNRELQQWTVNEYLSHGIARGLVTPLPIEKIPGGLKGVDKALNRLHEGVGGIRLVVDPWE